MKITITKEHFDRSVAQKWSSETCILSQAALDAGLNHQPHPVFADAGTILASDDKTGVSHEIMRTFDREWQSGNLQSPRLQELRNSLPITVEI